MTVIAELLPSSFESCSALPQVPSFCLPLFSSLLGESSLDGRTFREAAGTETMTIGWEEKNVSLPLLVIMPEAVPLVLKPHCINNKPLACPKRA